MPNETQKQKESLYGLGILIGASIFIVAIAIILRSPPPLPPTPTPPPIDYLTPTTQPTVEVPLPVPTVVPTFEGQKFYSPEAVPDPPIVKSVGTFDSQSLGVLVLVDGTKSMEEYCNLELNQDTDRTIRSEIPRSIIAYLEIAEDILNEKTETEMSYVGVSVFNMSVNPVLEYSKVVDYKNSSSWLTELHDLTNPDPVSAVSYIEALDTITSTMSLSFTNSITNTTSISSVNEIGVLDQEIVILITDGYTSGYYKESTQEEIKKKIKL